MIGAKRCLCSAGASKLAYRILPSEEYESRLAFRVVCEKCHRIGEWAQNSSSARQKWGKMVDEWRKES